MEALKSPLMGLFEKRRARNFFVYVQNYNEADPVTHQGLDLTRITTRELISWVSCSFSHHSFYHHCTVLISQVSTFCHFCSLMFPCLPCCYIFLWFLYHSSPCCCMHYTILHLLWPLSACSVIDEELKRTAITVQPGISFCTISNLFCRFIVRKHGLSDDTVDFIGHALALHRDDRYLNQPALDTVKRMKVCPIFFPSRKKVVSEYLYYCKFVTNLPPWYICPFVIFLPFWVFLDGM